MAFEQVIGRPGVLRDTVTGEEIYTSSGFGLASISCALSSQSLSMLGLVPSPRRQLRLDELRVGMCVQLLNGPGFVLRVRCVCGRCFDFSNHREEPVVIHGASLRSPTHIEYMWEYAGSWPQGVLAPAIPSGATWRDVEHYSRLKCGESIVRARCAQERVGIYRGYKDDRRTHFVVQFDDSLGVCSGQFDYASIQDVECFDVGPQPIRKIKIVRH